MLFSNCSQEFPNQSADCPISKKIQVDSISYPTTYVSKNQQENSSSITIKTGDKKIGRKVLIFFIEEIKSSVFMG